MSNKSVSQIEVTLRFCKTCFAKLVFTDSRFATFFLFHHPPPATSFIDESFLPIYPEETTKDAFLKVFVLKVVLEC